MEGILVSPQEVFDTILLCLLKQEKGTDEFGGRKMKGPAIQGFYTELEKVADLVSKQTFERMSDYGKQKMVDARDAISEAAKKKSKLSRDVRARIIESAFDNLKNISYEIAGNGENGGPEVAQSCPSDSGKDKKKKLKL